MLRCAPGALATFLRAPTTVLGPSNHLRASSTRGLFSTAVSRGAIHPSKPLPVPLFYPSYPLRDAASSIPKEPFLTTIGIPKSDAAKAPEVASKGVGNWLIGCGILVIGVVAVGGVTRLTESGLSITEWRPVTGILPPLNSQEWEEEFNKYRLTPEFKLLNSRMNVEDFKSIFYMEWGHRILGRLIGVVFAVPYVYFLARRQLPGSLKYQLGGLGVILGAQGALGWYMVKSGLEEQIIHDNAVPRVSQYRLAAHLGGAFLFYIGCMKFGLAIRRDAAWAKGGLISGMGDGLLAVLNNPTVRRFKRASGLLFTLVFLTAISGAFVAGLDAGLVYNEFPYMGDGLVPPKEELLSPSYAKSADRSDIWRNFFENPTTVQFDHRILGTTTYTAAAALYAATFLPALKQVLPVITRRLALASFAVANLQVALGITTLLYLVPVPLAAAHQAGSVALLTAVLALMGSLRKPSAVARALRPVRKLPVTQYRSRMMKI